MEETIYNVKIFGPGIESTFVVADADDFEILILHIMKMEKKLGIEVPKENIPVPISSSVAENPHGKNNAVAVADILVPKKRSLEDAPAPVVPPAVKAEKYVKPPARDPDLPVLPTNHVPYRWQSAEKNGEWTKHFFLRIFAVGNHIEVIHYDRDGNKVDDKCRHVQLDSNATLAYQKLRQHIYNGTALGHTVTVTETKPRSILEN